MRKPEVPMMVIITSRTEYFHIAIWTWKPYEAVPCFDWGIANLAINKTWLALILFWQPPYWTSWMILFLKQFNKLDNF